MQPRHLTAIAGFLLASTSAVMAGGFQRGIADTDILYERGTFATRLGVTYVDPNRAFTSVNGASVDGSSITQSYVVPSYAVYFGSDAFGCAGNYVESFGAEVDYRDLPDAGVPFQNSSTQSTSNVDRLNFTNAAVRSRTQTIEFDSDEFSATCRASYSTQYGRFSLLGGLFLEDFDFSGSTLGFRNLNAQIAASGAQGAGLVGLVNRLVPGGQITLPTAVEADSSSGTELGFRIGAAYEIPEIALRIQGLYRSEVTHDDISGSGSVTITDTAYVSVNGQRVSVPTTLGTAITTAVNGAGLTTGRTFAVSSSLNDSTSPQSFTLNAQTGIAEGTLLLGSFRWTDWSTNNAVVSTITGPVTGTSSSYIPFNWRDGYTASLGLGKAFNESVSGLVSLGYDRGVSTGADTIYTDLYTLSGGVSLKSDKWAELRFGGLVGYWTDGEQRISDGAYFDADVGNDFVWALNASLKLTF